MNCSIAIPNGFQGDYKLQVSGVLNGNLANSTQGLCGVNLRFTHEFIGELDIQLISPAGQVVQLVAASNANDTTFFALWDVGFVQCNAAAMPDPGRDAQWDNNAWGIGTQPRGLYYPATGCLENFDTGPVNGNWTLRIKDKSGAVTYGGFLQGFSLEFCSPEGMNCQPTNEVVLPGTSCENAAVVPNLDEVTGSMTSTGTPQVSPPFCGTVEHGLWYGFVAAQPEISIFLQSGNCLTGDGVQAAIYEDCAAPSLVCNGGMTNGSGLPLSLTTDQLVPGRTYFLLVDGYAGDVCDFEIETVPATFGTLGQPLVPQGKAALCEGGTAEYTIPPVFGTVGYKWTITGNGTFQDQTQEIIQYSEESTPVTVNWGNGAGNLCVQVFNTQDTSQIVCLQVKTTEITEINYPAVYLCPNQLPYQLPFSQDMVTASGIYTRTVASTTNACDTLYSISVIVATEPDVFFPPVILFNDQCFFLPNGQQICSPGEYDIEVNNASDCSTTYHFKVNKITVGTLQFACAPVGVPFRAEGPNAEELKWIFPGGLPADTVGSQPEVVYTQQGNYGFTVMLGTTAQSYGNLFNIGETPQANFSFQSMDNTFTFNDLSTGAPSQFEWDFGDNITAVGQNQIHDYAQEGVFQVTLTVSNPCGESSTTQQVSWIDTATEQAEISKGWTITPNPSKGNFRVIFESSETVLEELHLISILGKTEAIFTVQNQFNIENLPDGVYFAVAYTNRGIMTKKVVLRNK